MIDRCDYVVEFKSISKNFENTQALKKVSFGVKKGEVHGLLGENGAGKSTLVRILTGTHVRSNGEILLEGKPYTATSSLDAASKGVSIVFQESNLVPSVSVAENIFMGTLSNFSVHGIIRWEKVYQRAKEILSLVGLEEHVDPKAPVAEYDFAVRKMIEFAKQLSNDSKIMILDEITACLTQGYIDIAFDWIRKKKAEGVSIIYISHRMEELFEICDMTTVLRDGEYITTVNPHDMTEVELSSLTVGRQLEKNAMYYFNRIQQLPIGEAAVLSIKDLSLEGKFRNVCFDLRKGEILSIVGLDGSGAEEVMASLFGVFSAVEGEIFIRGTKKAIRDCKQAINSGLGYVPKEREKQGIVNIFSVKENISMPIMDRLKTGLLLDRKKEDSIAGEYVDMLNVKCRSVDDICSQLSGGNKQKVVLAKWLATQAKIMLLNNPTRGVDVGVKSDIYKIIFKLVERGTSVLLVTGELMEAIKLSHRIITMAYGEKTGEFLQNERPITETELISKMM